MLAAKSAIPYVRYKVSRACGRQEFLHNKVGRRRTALQKKVSCALPIWANAAKTKPNKPCVASLAIFSTRVKAFRASALLDAGHISVMTPLAAGAVPEANGSKKAARGGQLVCLTPWRIQCGLTEIDVPAFGSKSGAHGQNSVYYQRYPEKEEVKSSALVLLNVI